MSRCVFVLVVGWVLLSSAPLMAQDAVLSQVYGKGVHAYFAQDYVKAHEQFTFAIDGHTQDPRCYYFRGLALLKMGRPQDAEIDFQQGAKLESVIDPTRAFNVARSLERIQGNDRSTLEQYRLAARAAVLKKTEDERRIKYDEGRKEERDFLQKQSEAAPTKTIESSTDATKAVDVPSDSGKATGAVPADPFDAGKPSEPKKEDAGAGPAASPKTDNPADALKSDAAKPDAGKPDATKPEATKPDAVKPAGGDDPFGGGDMKKPAGDAKPDATKPAVEKPDAGKPAGGDDPFGGGDAKKPAGDAKPDAGKTNVAKPDAGKPAVGEADDPFGGTGAATKPASGAKPDAGKPEKAKPDAAKPAGGDDPFGGGDDAKKPAAGAKSDAAKPEKAKPDADKPAGGDDPFGGGDDAKKPAAGAKSDAAKPEKAKPDAAKPAGGDDPFGGGDDAKKPAAAKDGAKAAGPAAGSPFVDEPEKKPADAKKPADDKKPADAKKPANDKKDDDPFGG